jgi:MFS family permease
MNNRFTLLVASFMTLIAAGVGFAIRGGILGDWGAQFGFTKGELGTITGGGLTGFGITILACSLIVDRVGYKSLLVVAFLLHALSAVITLAATPVFEASGKDATYWCLYIGMFMFALANGVCESVINPLIATVYSKEKTHYLNILHAGWPGGLILGALFAYFFCGPDAKVSHLRWEIPMAVFLIPTVIYGLLVLKEKFPVSEVAAAGVRFGDMLSVFASPILWMLLLLHACIGYVELGTDSWITNILENVVGSNSLLLFVYASGLMFVLRFFAGPIVERINPVGLLMLSSALGCIGLYSLSMANAAGAIILAYTIYGVGKTFLWPTILGVVGERYPKGGALVMGAMGGVGMLSAGLLGGPGIGYKQDYYASKHLQASSADTYARYKSDSTNSFLFFPPISGLDGSKVAILNDDGKELANRVEILSREGRKDEKTSAQIAWWDQAKDEAQADAPEVKEANVYGGRMALRWTSVVPLTMAVGFGLLFAYFAVTGGYQAVELRGHHPKGEEFTGGVEGPVEG